jgi:hypothetical protein
MTNLWVYSPSLVVTSRVKCHASFLARDRSRVGNIMFQFENNSYSRMIIKLVYDS